MSRALFLTIYAEKLFEDYPWAQDEAKLNKYMASVIKTLDGGNSWTCEGSALTWAWKQMGGKGKPTLKALRALN